MRAIVCERFGGPETVALHTDYPEPEPGPGQVKVRIAARAVQYVDVLMVAGKYQFRPEPPFIPGGEAAGEIVALGEGVTGYTVGQTVMSRHAPGGFADYGVCPLSELAPVPKGFSMEQAAGFRSAYATAYHALIQRGHLASGETLVVLGAAGGIGLAAIQVAKALGANVIAVSSSTEKQQATLQAGADHAIDYGPPTDGNPGRFRETIKEMTGGKGADVFWDPLGGWAFEECTRCINWGGRILILGFLAGEPALAKTNHLLIKGASAVGVRLGGVNDYQPELAASNIAALIEMASDGLLNPVVSKILPLESAAEALQMLIDRTAIGKVVLT
ncbi:MAG: NADPH:quinone oxidoreductase family protein [Alphaproteobacteria bacterium]